MDAHLRAGIAVYNAGRYHAAHDAWEDVWLDLEAGDDERLLHGLIQFTAVVHHASRASWSGAQGLAESASGYLAGLPEDYRDVDLDAIRPFLAQVAADPEHAERVAPPELTHDGVALDYEALDFESTVVAAQVLAEADGYDEAAVEDAVGYARAELAERGEGTFVGLLFSFVREGEKRPVVAQRLVQHVERERGKDRDVRGLFE